MVVSHIGESNISTNHSCLICLSRLIAIGSILNNFWSCTVGNVGGVSGLVLEPLVVLLKLGVNIFVLLVVNFEEVVLYHQVAVQVPADHKGHRATSHEKCILKPLCLEPFHLRPVHHQHARAHNESIVIKEADTDPGEYFFLTVYGVCKFVELVGLVSSLGLQTLDVNAAVDDKH